MARSSDRRQLGLHSLVAAALPSFVFVVVHATSSQTAAMVATGVAATCVAAWVLVRRHPVLPAVWGLLVVLASIGVVMVSGEARGYFLLQVLTSFATTALCLGSVLVRRPLCGVLLHRVVGGRAGWREDVALLRTYARATLVCALVSAVTTTLQSTFYVANWTSASGLMTAADGPLWAVVAVGVVVVGRRAVSRATGEV